MHKTIHYVRNIYNEEATSRKISWIFSTAQMMLFGRYLHIIHTYYIHSPVNKKKNKNPCLFSSVLCTDVQICSYCLRFERNQEEERKGKQEQSHAWGGCTREEEAQNRRAEGTFVVRSLTTKVYLKREGRGEVVHVFGDQMGRAIPVLDSDSWFWNLWTWFQESIPHCCLWFFFTIKRLEDHVYIIWPWPQDRKVIESSLLLIWRLVNMKINDTFIQGHEFNAWMVQEHKIF